MPRQAPAPLTVIVMRAEALNPTDPASPNPSWKLPLTGLGPFGPTSKCVGDAWPNGHCSMKTIVNLASPKFWDTKPSECCGL
jgi:hypothetical protein